MPGSVVRSSEGAGAEKRPTTRVVQGERAMRSFRGLIWGCALAALVAGGGTAQAAWNNVFQVCCNSCRTPAPAAPVIAAYGGDACPQPCPQPQTQCTTRYVQRS